LILGELPVESVLFFFTGLLFAISSVWTLANQKHKQTGWLLFLMTFFIGLAFANATSYFFIWDEQFHALVAKNLSENPFHPQLMNFAPWLFENANWSSQTTWLHKPPLFLYAMASSIQLFGNTVFAARLPSVIILSVTARLIYLFGNQWNNRNVGFLAVIIFVFSGFTFLQLSGIKSTDHNDVFFTCLVFISFFFLQKYLAQPDWKSAVKIGLIVGLCVLTKWLTGLLAFLPWGILVVRMIVQQKGDFKIELKRYLLAVLVAIVIALPWHIYTILNFHEVALIELSYNQKHFWDPLEGHRESVWYHFENLWSVFGSIIVFSFLPFFKPKKINLVQMGLWISILALLIFYSFAATKMEGFIGPLLPFLSLLIAHGVLCFFSEIGQKRIILLSLPLFLFYFHKNLGMKELGMIPETIENEHHHLYLEQKKFIEKWSDSNPKKMILNANLRMHGNIQWMYFSENKAIVFVPNKQEIERLKKEGFELTAIQFGKSLPEYILNDNEIEKIAFEE
jgi:4-amino-4-deoxy-L-arabinose transferase